MNLVNHQKAQIPEQGWDLHMFVDQQRFQGFRGNLQNAGGFLQELPLACLGDIPVPAGHGDSRLPAQLLQPAELIVDKGL